MFSSLKAISFPNFTDWIIIHDESKSVLNSWNLYFFKDSQQLEENLFFQEINLLAWLILCGIYWLILPEAYLSLYSHAKCWKELAVMKNRNKTWFNWWILAHSAWKRSGYIPRDVVDNFESVSILCWFNISHRCVLCRASVSKTKQSGSSGWYWARHNITSNNWISKVIRATLMEWVHRRLLDED